MVCMSAGVLATKDHGCESQSSRHSLQNDYPQTHTNALMAEGARVRPTHLLLNRFVVGRQVLEKERDVLLGKDGGVEEEPMVGEVT